MINQENYKELLQKIVDKHLDDDSIVFDMKGDEIVEDAVNGRKFSHVTGHNEHFGAADASMVKTVLDIAVVAFTGYKVLLDIIKLRKEQPQPVDFDSLIPKLEESLKKNGIKSAEKARVIAADFIKEASLLVNK